MKKYLTTIALYIARFFNFSTNTEHMKFKGISLEENALTFVNALKDKGFKFIMKYDKDNYCDYYCMEGNFAGYYCCNIHIVVPKDNNFVCKVQVFLHEDTDWNSIKYKYNAVSDIYTKKYGKPNDSIHYFEAPYVEGDGNEMNAISNGNCIYYELWDVGTNCISLSISDTKQVLITYQDTENVDILNKNIKDSIQDEI